MIPILELKTQYAQIQQEIEEAALRVLRSTHYILGPEVEAFEQEFAAYNQGKFGIGVANGTDALQLAFRALEVGPGDEVICPSFTFVATAGAVALTGATPVFVDIDKDSFTVNVESVRKAITPKTKAIAVVHLYGHAAPIYEIKKIADEHGIPVVEDCAQAAGALIDGHHVSSIGAIGCYSFFPTKNLGGVGDGGMCITNDEELAQRIKMLRGHGSSRRYYHDLLGTNSRLDEIQAAVLRVKLKYVDKWNDQRRVLADRYREQLAGSFVTTPIERPNCKHIYHQFTILTPDRDNLKQYLQDNGVGSMIYYPVAMHLQKTFANAGYKLGDLPVSEDVQDHCLSLPVYPELTIEQIDEIAAKIKSFQPQA